MDSKQNGNRSLRRRSGLVGLLLCLAAGVSAEVVVEPEVAAVGEVVTIQFVVPSRAEGLRIVEPVYPPIIEARGGPLVRSAIREDQDGRTRPVAEVVLEFDAVAPGRRIVGPFYAESSSGRIELGSTLVQVGTERDPSTVPFGARWQVATPTPYVGQTIPLVLLMTNLVEPVYPDSITVPALSQGDDRLITEVDGLGRVGTRDVGAVTLYSIPVASYLLTPTEAGPLEIGEAVIAHDGIESTAEPIAVQVRPLPDPVAPFFAVGRFELSHDGVPESVEVGREFVVRVEVAGEGNLQFLRVPLPLVEGAELMDTSEELVAVPSDGGYVGRKTLIHTILADREGEIRVEQPRFRWFDPATGETEGEAFTLYTQAAGAGENVVVRSGFADVSPIPSEEFADLDRPRLFTDWYSYLVFVPGPLFLLLCLLIRRRHAGFFVLSVFVSLTAACGVADSEHRSRNDAALEAFESGDFQGAYERYSSLAREMLGSAAVRYNAAVAAERLGRVPAAIHFVREAIRLNPGSARTRGLLRRLESAAGLTGRLEPPHTIDPDLVFVLLAVAWNGLFVLVAVRTRRRRGVRIIVSLMVAVVVAGLAGLFAAVLAEQADQPAVVSDRGAVVTRIPEADAERWVVLPEGTAVRPGATAGEFVLVTTGYGVEGWIRGGDLFREGE